MWQRAILKGPYASINNQYNIKDQKDPAKGKMAKNHSTLLQTLFHPIPDPSILKLKGN